MGEAPRLRVRGASTLSIRAEALCQVYDILTGFNTGTLTG